MSVIPRNLNVTFSNLQGYRKSLTRWYADRTGAINANDVLRFTFPKEIILMDSLMHFFYLLQQQPNQELPHDKEHIFLVIVLLLLIL